ncbi:carboxymuconolactone decarboxylase family protein [Gallibacterium trehalosifermentans]|uniref:Carboxymuconolactone decarboxylase family protein n=1 Tax=Gallibacterium trehalosifermentans TaxID=516935 RepID=A0ABV6H1C8_9PAST
MSVFPIHTIESAPESTRSVLEAVKKANGFIPNLIGVLANAPTALETYRTVGEINGRNSLTAEEREVVQITAAVVNGCGFCVAGHTKISLKLLRMPKEVVEAIRTTARIDASAKLDTLARFTLVVILQKAKLTQAQLQAFFAAGYTPQNAIDVILGVSLATLCNYVNNLAETPINPELQEFI